MKKALALVLAALLLVSMAACTGTAPAATTAAAAETTAATETEATEASAETESGKTYTVGICQLVQHPALDAATQGFKDALTEALGDAVSFNEQNASGESVNCATIVNGLVASQVDLILANATAPLQAAASATADIPVLGTAVTDYASALEIDNWTGTVGGNISGTSDLAPLDQQAAMLQELFPDAKTVGLLYCSAEANSQYQVDTVKKYLEEKGVACTLYPFADSNDVAAVTQTACDASDVIYVPTDNTVAANTAIVANICLPAGKPVVAGEEGMAKGCGVATLSISYYDLGVTTGKMAAKILKGEANISEMPIEYAENFTPEYNPVVCEELGVTVPDTYQALDVE